ncbi:MAG TPA: branched-chain amino acid ABC transporter permease, partial [Firmicutes bacterium]|nr:branched-chain amino acid ABC transporter permease [Bacillota bacterium]
MELFWQTLLGGLLNGGLFALMAIGLTIIFGVMHIINMAHGDFLMLGMYISFWAYLFWKISPFVSMALAFILVMVVGALIYHFVVRRIEGQATENSLLLTAGISFIIASLARYLFTPDYRRVSYPLSNEAWYLGDVSINKHAFWAFLAALILTLLLALFLKYSRAGSAIRATAQNRIAA